MPSNATRLQEISFFQKFSEGVPTGNCWVSPVFKCLATDLELSVSVHVLFTLQQHNTSHAVPTIDRLSSSVEAIRKQKPFVHDDGGHYIQSLCYCQQQESNPCTSWLIAPKKWTTLWDSPRWHCMAGVYSQSFLPRLYGVTCSCRPFNFLLSFGHWCCHIW